MDGTKVSRQRDEKKESYMVGTEITRQSMENLNGRHEKNSPKGWTAQNN